MNEKKNWATGFSDLPTINAAVFNQIFGLSFFRPKGGGWVKN